MNMFYDKIIKKTFSLILDRSKTTLTAKPSKTQAYHTLDIIILVYAEYI